MRKYKENEEFLFKLLKLNFFEDLKLCKDEMSRYDCYSDKHGYIIELKCRNTHYDSLRLEKIKYDSLIEIANEKLYIPLYANETTKGVYVFNLFEIEPEWTEQYNPKTTSFSNRQMIKKWVYDIPIKDASTIFKKH